MHSQKLIFSPDGQYVVYQRTGYGALLCWRTVDGQCVLDEKTNAKFCDFSRDGKVLVWCSQRDQNEGFHTKEL